MHIIARTLVILLVTGIVCGGIYLLAQSDIGRSLLAGNSIRFENRGQFGFESKGALSNNRAQGDFNRRNPGVLLQGQQPDNSDPRNNGGPFPSGGFERGGRDGFNRNGFGWLMGFANIARNFGLIAGMTGLIVIVQKIYGWVSRRRRAVPVMSRSE